MSYVADAIMQTESDKKLTQLNQTRTRLREEQEFQDKTYSGVVEKDGNGIACGPTDGKTRYKLGDEFEDIELLKEEMKEKERKEAKI